jgi:ABC-type branched-subunit amino acid transport system substrate-binding protein
MDLKILFLLLTAGFAASCSTAEPKKPVTRPSVIKVIAGPTSRKRPKRIAGIGAPISQDAPVKINPLEAEKGISNPPAQNISLTDTLKKLVVQFAEATDKTEKESYLQYATDIVDNKLNESALVEVSEGSEYGFLRAHAMYRLAEQSLTAKDPKKAKKYYTNVIDLLPDSELANKASYAISQLEAVHRVDKRTIGTVLPLSGKNAPVGQRALRGLEMGLGLHLPGSKFKLAIMDSEGNPDSARRGVERLVKEDGAIAIVGSLLSKTAPAVAAKSDELGVPSIALSQRAGITEIGSTVFRNSLTSEMQVRYLVRTAINDLGMKKFAILYPNDPYGIEFTNIFWDEVLARGGQITAVQTYSTKETDFRLVIQRLIGTYYGEARIDEFKVRLKEMKKSDKKKSARNDNLETVLPPITDFDGIFIPDSSKALGQIAAMLAFNDVRDVKLLGTNLWNTPGLSKRAGNFINNLLFVDSITPLSKNNQTFMNEYKNLYNETPSLIEIQAYDSGLILRHLISNGASTRDDLAKKLTELEKFPGALGLLSVTSDREIDRPLTPLTLEKGEIVPLKIKIQ